MKVKAICEWIWEQEIELKVPDGTPLEDVQDSISWEIFDRNKTDLIEFTVQTVEDEEGNMWER